MHSDLGTFLVSEHLITARQWEKAQQRASQIGQEPVQVLIGLGFVSEGEIAELRGRQLGVPFVELEAILEPGLGDLIPSHLAQRYQVFPICQDGNRLRLAMLDPLNVLAIDDIRLITGFDIEPAIATPSAIEAALRQHTGVTGLAVAEESIVGLDTQDFPLLEADMEEVDLSQDQLTQMSQDAPIVRVVNLIISQAINDRASDIHIEPDSRDLKVRYRVDGVLHQVMAPPKHIQAPMVSRIKIMAAMDIAERRQPQDGKIHLHHDQREYDLRVSTVPTVHGEKTVMRILDRNSVQLGLNKLGFGPSNLLLWESLVDKPYGMALVTGPTGSGKSTTLYSCLHRLNRGDRNLTTVEDPVEYQISGINQVQTNPKAGLTFASALKSFLRQDPDILMVGEIRDGETAKIAVEAALTGHLVLSTLHTNDACGAVSRLVEMGVEPFLISSALLGVLAQRLARCICPSCKEAYRPEAAALRGLRINSFGENDLAFFRGRGCEHCKNSGYRGRSGVHEVLNVSERLRSLILGRASSYELRQAAIEEGMRSLQDDAVEKILQGMTTVEEALRVVSMEGSES